jgi:hypothetical protein
MRAKVVSLEVVFGPRRPGRMRTLHRLVGPTHQFLSLLLVGATVVACRTLGVVVVFAPTSESSIVVLFRVFFSALLRARAEPRRQATPVSPVMIRDDPSPCSSGRQPGLIGCRNPPLTPRRCLRRGGNSTMMQRSLPPFRRDQRRATDARGPRRGGRWSARRQDPRMRGSHRESVSPPEVPVAPGAGPSMLGNSGPARWNRLQPEPPPEAPAPSRSGNSRIRSRR